jgi:hypothetical protein
MSVTVVLKGGEKRRFDKDGYSSDIEPSVQYEGVFAIVRDQYGVKTAFPADSIQEITIDAPRRNW